MRRNDSLLHSVILITTVCVVLYNICESIRDDCLEEWTITDDGTFSTPSSTGPPACSASSIVHDAIASYIHARQ